MKKSQKKQIIVVGLAVIFDAQNRILLTKRHAPALAHVHDKWQLPGGTLEYGEDPKETAIREVKEETNLVIEVINENPIMRTNIFAEENLQVILLTYIARYKSGTLDFFQDELTSDAQWYNYEDIATLDCLPQTKEVIEQAKKFLGGK